MPAGVGVGRGGNLWTKPIKLPDTLIVNWGLANSFGFNNNPVVFDFWTTPTPGRVWYWAETSGSYFSGAGTADNTGTTGNEFIDNDVFEMIGPRCPPDLGIQRALTIKGVNSAVVRIGQGTTTMFSDWSAPPFNGGSQLFALMVNEVNKALIDPSLPINPELMLWYSVCGERDAVTLLHANNYQPRLQNAWDVWKATFPQFQHMAVIIQLHPDSLGANTALVRAGQAAFVAANPTDTILIDSSDQHLNSDDDLHFPPEANLSMAVSAINQFITKGLVIGASFDYSSVNFYRNIGGGGPAGSTTMTFLGYFFPPSDEATEFFIYRRLSVSSGFSVSVSSNLVGIRIADGGGNIILSVFPASIEIARVNQIGFRLVANVLSVFVNGNLIGTAPIAGYTPAGVGVNPEVGVTSVPVTNKIIALVSADTTALTDLQIAAAWLTAKFNLDFNITGASFLFVGQDAGGEWFDRIADFQLIMAGQLDIDLEQYLFAS